MKKTILQRVHELIDLQISNAKQAMDAAQESAMSDGKSSAGDKFETGRAMGHRDRDMYAQQLAIALKEKAMLNNIDVNIDHEKITLGSLVYTSGGIIFITTSLGKIKIEEQTIIAVSAQAPLSINLIGKKVGDTFKIQNVVHEIISIK
jgi:hypothetical protein